MLDINRVTELIIGSALRIHTRLGPGLFESVYQVVLARDLARIGLEVERQKGVRFEFEGMQFIDAFRLDLLVDRRVVVEVKCVERLAPVHI